MPKVAKKNLHEVENKEAEQPSLNIHTDQAPILGQPPAPAAPNEPEPEMLETQPDEEADTEPATEPEPAKRRPGRPSKNDPPVMRSGIINRINNLESWEATRVYVYRWEPFTDRKIGGRQSVAVKRYEGPFDEQDMLEDAGLGSGVYELVVNRTDPQTRQRRIIDSGMVKLFNMKFPPRIPKGEWVDDERNKDWEWARNICDKTEAPAPVSVIAPPDPLIELLRDQIRSQNERLSEMHREMREQQNKKDPNEQTILTVLLQKVLEKPAPPPPPPADPVRDMMVAFMMKQLEAKAEPVKVPDPDEALERALRLQEKLEERTGGKGAAARSRMSGNQEMIAELVKSAAPMVGPILNLVAMNAAQNKAQQQQPQQGPPMLPPQFTPQAPPPITPTAPPPTPQQPQQQPRPANGPQLVKTPTVEAFTEAVIDHLTRGKTGYDLGDWYLSEYGEDEFTDIRTEGKGKLIEDLRSQPHSWAKIEGYHEAGTLDAMIKEFVTWEPDSEDDEEEDDAPPPIAAADSINTGWTEVRP